MYELREASWFDRGTGHCKGIYDDSQDLALIIVEAEDLPGEKPSGDDGGPADGPGGFLKEDLLLTAKVGKDDVYARQQGLDGSHGRERLLISIDTLIVWTEQGTQLDIALSFQDTEGCEDVWQFIKEVQRHLSNLPSESGSDLSYLQSCAYGFIGESDQSQIPSSSSPILGSPVLGAGPSQVSVLERPVWEVPSLANIKYSCLIFRRAGRLISDSRDQEMWLRMQAKSTPGRERAVEHILSEVSELSSIAQVSVDGSAGLHQAVDHRI